MGVLLRLILLIIFIPVIILSIIAIIALLPLPAYMAGSKNLLSALIARMFSFIYLIEIFIYIIFISKRAGSVLDTISLKLDLTITNIRFFRRHYMGIISNRQVALDIFPPRMVQNILLDIYK